VKKILIVEDEFANALLLKEILKKINIPTIHISCGDELFQTLENNDIGLVLMDVKLPGTNGYDLTKQLKQKYPELPVVIQTAYAFSSDREKALNAGSDDYLSKPISKEKLIELVEKYIGVY